jgi:hypothetical protein
MYGISDCQLDVLVVCFLCCNLLYEQFTHYTSLEGRVFVVFPILFRFKYWLLATLVSRQHNQFTIIDHVHYLPHLIISRFHYLK